MKSRLAVPAALIALIALVLLSVNNSLDIAEAKNQSVLAELQGICQMGFSANIVCRTVSRSMHPPRARTRCSKRCRPSP